MIVLDWICFAQVLEWDDAGLLPSAFEDVVVNNFNQLEKLLQPTMRTARQY